MCGIVGFTGRHQAAPILLDGLSKLEYRGYDSAGIAVRDGEGETEVIKAKGRLKVLSEKTNGGEPTSNLAVTYSYKNWQFGVLGLFVFYPHGCVYKDELFNKYVQQKNKVRLADQGNMLVFTASFNFSHGRRYHTGSRKPVSYTHLTLPTTPYV